MFRKEILLLLLTILGICLLFIFSFATPREVSSQHELSLLIDNQKVSTEGNIVKIDTTSNKNSLLTLDNEIQILSSPLPQLIKGVKIRVEGKKDSFTKVLQIKASTIQILK